MYNTPLSTHGRPMESAVAHEPQVTLSDAHTLADVNANHTVASDLCLNTWSPENEKKKGNERIVDAPCEILLH